MTIESFKVLEHSGVPPKQAHAIGHAIELECAAGHETLATKVDIANLRAEMHEILHGVNSELVRWLFLIDARPDRDARLGRLLLHQLAGRSEAPGAYSTVTLFARLRGWSTSVPLRMATWYASSCSGIV